MATYASRTTGRRIEIDDDDAYDAYKDGEIDRPGGPPRQDQRRYPRR